MVVNNSPLIRALFLGGVGIGGGTVRFPWFVWPTPSQGDYVVERKKGIAVSQQVCQQNHGVVTITLQGTITYPTLGKAGKIIDSQVPNGMGHVMASQPTPM